jgi:3-hydroxyacyl-[acyl-carrier-protein] dehydratase
MRFNQLDRITELLPGQRLRAVKCVTLAEQHLHDHFPLFPVMPGVLMLEALTQAAAWLIRASEDFQHSMVTLQESRNIKFQDFVAPGDQLDVTVEVIKQDHERTFLKATGLIGTGVAVNGRLVMCRFNLADRFGEDPAVDQNVVRGHRQIFRLLTENLRTAQHVST